MTDDDKLKDVKTVLRRLQKVAISDTDPVDPAKAQPFEHLPSAAAPLELRRTEKSHTASVNAPLRVMSDDNLPAVSVRVSPLAPVSTPSQKLVAKRSSWARPSFVMPALLGFAAAAGVSIYVASLQWPDLWDGGGAKPSVAGASVPGRLASSSGKGDGAGSTAGATNGSASASAGGAKTGREPVVREAKSPARPAQPQRPLAENATPRAAGARAAAGVGAVAITGPAQAAEAAARLMSEGQVRKARSVLLRQSEKQLSPDVAWALARSYDPNVLRGISKPDASADIRQAERWYREWHRLAVAQGLVASTVSVDRLIRAMRP
ncbi:MAG: hypothetical protein KDJ36_03020 [Hyphomicrobiaceae bacterium]|nr:hypothetical protein [Hyphomicrobiaceae bacterium]